MSRSSAGKAIAVRAIRPILVACLLPLSSQAPASGFRPPDFDEYGIEDLGMDATAWFIAGFTYRSAMVGTAAQFAYPILGEGFFEDPLYLDALHATVGFDFLRFSWQLQDTSAEVMYLAPNFGIRYELYLAATISLALCARVGPALSHTNHPDAGNRVYWSAGIVGAWDLLDWLSVVFEFDWGTFNDTLRLGAMFRF